jgi:pimeloyl-ACP methyl ester carboxylesterase
MSSDTSSHEQTPNVPTLNYLSLNRTTCTANTTILLLHTGYSSHLEYSLVTPHLSSHHLLIPDLPSHGRSSSSHIPFSPLDAAALLADLIIKQSKTGKAHIIGVSAGGVIALYLASKYPDVVANVFVSGCGRNLSGSLAGNLGTAFLMGVAYPTIVLSIAWLPPSWFNWLYAHFGLSVPEGLQADQRAAAGYGIGGALARALLSGEVSMDLLEGVSARTLLVAAELDDDVEGSREMAQRLKKGNGLSRAVKLPGKRHVWSLQDGELFAKAAEGWLLNEEVIGQFEVL